MMSDNIAVNVLSSQGTMEY